MSDDLFDEVLNQPHHHNAYQSIQSNDDDIFGEVLNQSITFAQKGQRQGEIDGLKQGYFEALHLGLNKGNEVGEELGFYHACADVWKALADNQSIDNQSIEQTTNQLNQPIGQSIKQSSKFITAKFTPHSIKLINQFHTMLSSPLIESPSQPINQSDQDPISQSINQSSTNSSSANQSSISQSSNQSTSQDEFFTQLTSIRAKFKQLIVALGCHSLMKRASQIDNDSKITAQAISF